MEILIDEKIRLINDMVSNLRKTWSGIWIKRITKEVIC